MGFMKVSHILICFLLISLFIAPVSADLIIERIATANITDKNVWSSAISPDGSTIAYASYDASRNQQIFTIKIDGSEKKQLTNDPNRKWGIEWLTDEISFLSYDTDNLEKIFIVSPDGTGRRKLLNETIRQGREPSNEPFWGPGSWNPETKQILFTSIGVTGDEKIFIVNIDGTGLKQLYENDSRMWNPQWGPDGKSFVFISFDNNSIQQLFIGNVDGTEKKQITDDKFKKSYIDWGQGGILFVSSETALSSSEKIFIINPDGTDKKRLLDDGFSQEMPRWSRDGYTIIYEDIDIQGNKLIKVLDLQKPEVKSTVTPPVITSTISPTLIETPAVEKTPGESSLEEMLLSLVLIIGLIIVVMLVILGISNFMSKKK
jgi:TolB protein